MGDGLPDVDGVGVALAEDVGEPRPGADGIADGDVELLVDEELAVALGELAPVRSSAAGSTATPGREDAAAACAVEAPGIGMLERGLPVACGGSDASCC